MSYGDLDNQKKIKKNREIAHFGYEEILRFLYTYPRKMVSQVRRYSSSSPHPERYSSENTREYDKNVQYSKMEGYEYTEMKVDQIQYYSQPRVSHDH